MSRIVRRRRAFLLVLLVVPLAWWAIAAASGDGKQTQARATRSPFAGIPVESAAPMGSFAPDACIAFPPLGAQTKGVVFIDAGHGGLDPGSQGRLGGHVVYEKKLTLAIAKAATAQLRADGYRVVVSRWADTTLIVPGRKDVSGKLLTPDGVYRDLRARVKCANDAKAKVLISIHLNAFGDPSEGGAMTIYDPARSFSKANRELAGIVHASIISALRRAGWKGQDRFVLPDTAIGGAALTARGARYGHIIILGPRAKDFVPTPSAMPGVLIEPLFITNPDEAAFAASARGQAVLARAIADAVQRWFARG